MKHCICILFLTLLAVPSFAVISEVQHATTTNRLLSFASTVTAGDWFVVAVIVDDTTDTPFVSPTTHDNCGNATYTSAVQVTDAGRGSNTWIFYGKVVTTSASCTLTMFDTTPGSGMAAIGVEFTNIVGTSPLDKAVGASGSGTALNSGPTSATSQANELVFGVLTDGADTFTKGPSFTTSYTTTSILAQYKVVTSIGTYDSDGTKAVSSAWESAVATFKDVSPGAAPTMPPAIY